MGIDAQRFTTPLPSHLHCGVCFEISYPAVIVCAQEHHVCQTCYTKIEESASKGKCPLCQQAMTVPVKESLLLRRAVEEYRFTCRNAALGCYWIGAVTDEAKHARDDCDYSFISCALCHTLCLRSKFDDHHGVCPEVMAACPQGERNCGGLLNGGMRKRRELQAHLDSECGNWKCRAVEGCETRTKRANLAEHEAVCGAAAKRVTELEKRLDKQQTEISTLKSVVAQQQAKLAAFEAMRQPSSATMMDEIKKTSAPLVVCCCDGGFARQTDGSQHERRRLEQAQGLLVWRNEFYLRLFFRPQSLRFFLSFQRPRLPSTGR